MADDGIILKGITWDHPRGFDPLVAASAAYAQGSGVQVTWEKRSLQAFADEPIEQLAERYDLVVLDHPHIGQVAENGALAPLPLPADLETSTIGRCAESYVWSGECWAYAIDAACQMAVNRDNHYGPLPIYWDDFLKPDADRFRAITPLKPVDAFDTWLTLCASLKAQIPHNRDVFIAEGAAIRGLKILRALYRLGPDEAVDYNPINVLELLSQGGEFAYSPCLFGYINYAKPDFRAHRLSYCELPVHKDTLVRQSILGGAGLAVSAKTQHVDVAMDYARWLASDNIQSGVYLANNGQPASLKCWQAKARDPEYGRFFGGAFTTMSEAWTRPRDTWFIGFVDEVCELIPGFFRRGIPEDVFLKSLNALYQNHLKRRHEHA